MESAINAARCVEQLDWAFMASSFCGLNSFSPARNWPVPRYPGFGLAKLFRLGLFIADLGYPGSAPDYTYEGSCCATQGWIESLISMPRFPRWLHDSSDAKLDLHI